MTIENNFLVFANSSGADVEAQSSWVSDPAVASGFSTGQASSSKCNKAWRQGTIGTSLLAQYINKILSVDTIDDGTTSTLLSNLATSIRTNTLAVDVSSVVNVFNVNIEPAPISLVNGYVISFVPGITNTTSASLNLNGLGALPVVSAGGPLSGGELTAGNAFQLIYLTSINSWLLLNYQTTAITKPIGDSTSAIATTRFIQQAGFAPIASPALTGTPTSPTAPTGTDTTQIASTAFVKNAMDALIPSGSKLLFFNPTAPTGWTQVIDGSANNRMIRVVSVTGGTTGSGGTGGGGFGGTNDPIILTGAQVPQHIHTASSTVNDPGHSHQYAHAYSPQPQTGSTTQCLTSTYNDNTSTSTTGITVNTTVNSNSGPTSWTPQYLNAILCSRN